MAQAAEERGGAAPARQHVLGDGGRPRIGASPSTVTAADGGARAPRAGGISYLSGGCTDGDAATQRFAAQRRARPVSSWRATLCGQLVSAANGAGPTGPGCMAEETQHAPSLSSCRPAGLPCCCAVAVAVAVAVVLSHC